MPGLFDSLVGSPVNRQERVLRKALEARAEAFGRRPGYLYRGAGDYLLRHGKFFSGEQLPADLEHLKGQEGRCFENVLAACQADGSIRYFEGVYAVGAAHYTPHAWGVAADGRLLELTFPTDPTVLAEGWVYTSKLPVLPLEHWGYWGVEFDPAFVLSYWIAHNGYDPARHTGNVGILDRPTQDTEEGASEWRSEFPIYTYPYDPKRTAP